LQLVTEYLGLFLLLQLIAEGEIDPDIQLPTAKSLTPIFPLSVGN
jgi:hypothetical protein